MLRVAFYIVLLNITMLSDVMLNVVMLSEVMLNVVMLSEVILNVVMLSVDYVECRILHCSTTYHYAEWRYAECSNAE
jgi:hypothetical protein